MERDNEFLFLLIFVMACMYKHNHLALFQLISLVKLLANVFDCGSSRIRLEIIFIIIIK